MLEPITLPTLTTHCPLDCPDTCALDIEVSDGQVTKVGPAEGNPVTQGYICSKVAGFDGRQNHTQRILHPAKRIGAKSSKEGGSGGFERISWDEALDEISDRFKRLIAEKGGESILPLHYGGSNGIITEDFLDELFFARLGASRLDKNICAVPATLIATGMYGKMPGVAFEDYVHAKLIVIWGANPKRSNIHLVPYLREARKRGAKVVVIDPRRNFSHQEIDLHFPVLPGQDLPLALALIGHWNERGLLNQEFLDQHADGLEPLLAAAANWSLEKAAEVSGVELETIQTFADLYAEAEPAVTRCGWGVERNRNGARAIAAILAMPALMGKFGVRGGGYTMSNNGAMRFDFSQVFGSLDWTTREINMTRLAHELETRSDPRIEAMLVYNANPAVTVPHQAQLLEQLQREDLFTVVHDQVWTDTAMLADIVLPATTFLEHHDLRVGYGAYHVGEVRPVVEAVGEARSNVWLFGQLGQRMGFSDPAFGWSEEELAQRARQALAPIDAATEVAVGNGAVPNRAVPSGTVPSGSVPNETVPEADIQSRKARAWAVRFEGKNQETDNPIPFVNSMPLTADGKVHLTPEVLGEQPFHWQAPKADFPLALITPAGGKRINSTLGELVEQPLTVTLNPKDAADRSISSGDRVEVFNQLARIRCRAEISEQIRPNVVSMPKGVWRKNSEDGLTPTALCPDHVQDVGDAACFNDARVEIRAARR